MTLVVDANLLVALAIPLPFSELTEQRFEGWEREGETLFSPSLWEYEATSAIRKYVVQRAPSAEQVEQAMLRLDGLLVESVPTDAELRRSALSWATRLGRHAAYDSFYVALAERLECELWTADRRLANNCHRLGTDFVRLLA